MHKKKIKKEGWFIGRCYRHFDRPINFHKAKQIVTIPEKVTAHDFWPLLSYKIIERKFKGYKKNGKPNIRHKSRQICYAAHLDSHIYAYYAQQLEKRFATLRQQLNIDDCILAYRPGKGSNIHMANAAFQEIKKRNSCSVIAMDISGFFDNIDHSLLKHQWCNVLGTNKLPEDHFHLFKAITRFTYIDRAACLDVLGIKKSKLKKSTQPLCSSSQFHQKICGREAEYTKLIMLNGTKQKGTNLIWNSFGIPQGTPISAVLSNISMISFDVYINNFIEKLGGKYYRYSDDILIICPTEHEHIVEGTIEEKITEQGLKINKQKTEISRFTKQNNKTFCQRKKDDGSWTCGIAQYLGLTFDGKNIALRHSTIARFQRKTKYAVREARRNAQHFKKDKIRSKNLYQKFTDIGSQSVPAYAANVTKITGDNAAKKQLRHHKEKLKSLISQENEKIPLKKINKIMQPV